MTAWHIFANANGVFLYKLNWLPFLIINDITLPGYINFLKISNKSIENINFYSMLHLAKSECREGCQLYSDRGFIAS